MADHYEMPLMACVHCGYQVNRAGVVSGPPGAPPTAGDLTACLACGQPMVFTADLGLRALAAEEWRALPEQTRRELMAVKAVSDHMRRATNLYRARN